MQIIVRLSALIIFSLLLSACSSKAKFEQYDKQLNEIRSDVRTIRLMADQMRNEVINMKTTVGIMNENAEKQSKDIENAKENQKKLAETLDGIKSAVVKLETETIPQKKEEIQELNRQSDGGSSLVAKKIDGITVVETVKDADIADMKKTKYIEASGLNAGFGYAVKDGVILWRSPSINSEIVEVLLSWQQVAILGSISSEGTKWLKIKTDDYTGYADSKYIMVSEKKIQPLETGAVKKEPLKTESAVKQEYGCVTSDNGLKIRINPAADSDGIRNIRYMTRVKLLELSKDSVWYKIAHMNDIGYVYAKFIRPDKNGRCETE